MAEPRIKGEAAARLTTDATIEFRAIGCDSRIIAAVSLAPESERANTLWRFERGSAEVSDMKFRLGVPPAGFVDLQSLNQELKSNTSYILAVRFEDQRTPRDLQFRPEGLEVDRWLTTRDKTTDDKLDEADAC